MVESIFGLTIFNKEIELKVDAYALGSNGQPFRGVGRGT